jgi:hypothetical protein
MKRLEQRFEQMKDKIKRIILEWQEKNMTL